MQTINILLKNENLRAYHRAGWLILTLHFLYFTFCLYHGLSHSGQGIIFIMLAVGYRGILYITQKKPFYPDVLFYYLMFCTWLNIENYIMASLVFTLGIINEFYIGKKVIAFSDKEIKKQYFPFTGYMWDQLQNVILKDNVLTLDFRNNRVFQAEIDAHVKIDSDKFNESAQKNLNHSLIK